MMQRTERVTPIKVISGWASVGLMALGFVALYLVNYLVPLAKSNYTTRIWDWTELALTAVALVVLALQWRAIRARTIWLGGALGMLSGLSYLVDDSSLRGGATAGIAVWFTFMAGTVLFQNLKRHAIAAFRPPWTAMARSVGFGILLGIPLAALNNLFFYLQNGAPRFHNIFVSAAEALSPGIHEEAVFRYFILAICFSLLQESPRPRLVMIAAIVLAVVPHSLLHLPDLFLENPVMAVVMLVATSLLFGLPMALLQIKRSFESAVAFHWFIDFVRFWFGY
jgi:hypothetical protein